MIRYLLTLLWAALLATSSVADTLSARARIDPGRSFVVADGKGVAIELYLTQGVPWRIRTLDAPRRIAVDLREVSWDGWAPHGLDELSSVGSIVLGQTPDGWSRFEVGLEHPMRVSSAEMLIDSEAGAATVSLRLSPASDEEFTALVTDEVTLQAPPTGEDRAGGPIVVLLDPGHGGVDPGAEADGVKEADLTLTFARELKDRLLRAGGFEVHLTRDDDVFVSLEARVALAHELGADLFLSLHADALPVGHASGATVYTLSADASDAASAKLAERHDRDNLVSGVDLQGQDDTVARVLMDLARNETQPRSERLADGLVKGIAEAVGRVDSNPRREAGFSVLKSADIPSVLVELGFLTDARDLADLKNPGWRAKFAQGVVDGLQRWRIDEAAAEALVRN